MFVSKKKYDSLFKLYSNLVDSNNTLAVKWFNVVTLINSKGGQQFLDHATIGGKEQFTDDDLRSLLQLVHPDKHDGKASAVRLTQKINQLRK